MAAAVAMLDKVHANPNLKKHTSDNNTYTLGEINNHNIAIACLPFRLYGTTPAATVAGQMSSTFTSIGSWLMVGIGGGVPSAKVDIRLGDIVVSTGVIQYDFGKTVREGRFEPTAAAYAKELLFVIPPAPRASKIREALADSDIVQKTQPKDWRDSRKKIIVQRKLFMETLKFNQIDTRKATIEDAHTETCKWLLENQAYCDWLDSNLILNHHGFLWIKGKPGTGKSTLMKFAFQHAEKITNEALIISFFFNARGEDLEKSTSGMYRSLLYQLLKKVPEVQSVFDSMESPSTLVGSDPRNIGMLKETFRQALRVYQEFSQWRLICFIDALDECEEDQIRDMIAFFENLGQFAVSEGIQLRVCFSSRHYPHITIKKGQELILEGQKGHDYDIVKYIRSELQAKHSRVEEIRTEIRERASGIFLWVVLVVRILNKEYDAGRLHTIHKRLREIPTGLNELFKDILTRDTQNTEALLLCIQWILYAKRPLRPVELYFAILAGEFPEYLGAWDPADITEEFMGRFVLSSSKGLAEVTKSADRTVQFIHESVRDFLLKEHGLNELRAALRSPNSNERLKQCCYTYMKIITFREPMQTGVEESSTISGTLWSEYSRLSTLQQFPFFEYAVRNVLYHADQADSSIFPQEAFIDQFPLQDWIIFHNNVAIEVNQVRHYTFKASLLYIFAERNLPNLSKIELKRSPTMDIEGEYYCFPILAALANGGENVVRVFLTFDADSQSDKHKYSGLYARHQQEVSTLLKEGRYLKVPRGQTLFAYAAEKGKWGIASLLLATGKVDVDTRMRGGGTLLSYAAAEGHDEIIDMLLERGAGLDFQDVLGRTPLSYAAERGHTTAVELLLRGNARPWSAHDSKTPLSHAAANGHAPVVELLLNCPEYKQGGISQVPLYHAVMNGHRAVVELLLGKGVKVNAEFTYENHSMIWNAIKRGYNAVVKLLLENGANPELKVSDRTMLLFATEVGQEMVVKMLLEKGARLESKTDTVGQTALSVAAMMGHQTILTLLLEEGAELESEDTCGRTPLSYAASKGQEAIAKFLLEKGANINSRDISGRTPLHYAARSRNEAAARLLLEGGAELEARDDVGWTPLLHAAHAGHKTVVELLLKRGANVESKDGLGNTALHWAHKGSNWGVAGLLLRKGMELEALAMGKSGI
ncbi:hypothetical protein TWF173_000457 [Orbilia oligospora]|nr:hypothetical protein TWF173_000457 [Orbilia oligospora]